MSQLHQPEPPNVRGLAIAAAAHELEVEPDSASVRTPGGEPGQRAALKRRFDPALADPPAAEPELPGPA